MVIEHVLFWGLIIAIATQRVTELRLAKRNLEWALAQGGRLIEEPHYWMFFALHGGWLLAWPLEAYLREAAYELAAPWLTSPATEAGDRTN